MTISIESERGSDARENRMTLVEMATVVLRNWRLFVWLPLALAFVIGVHALLQPRRYMASATFLPQSTQSGGGGAAALAQQFGVNLGSDRPGESPQFYVDLLQSQTVLRRAVESEYDVGSAGRKVTLIELFEIDLEEDHPLPAWRRAANGLHDRISASVDWETGIVSMSVTAENPVLAERIAARLLELVNEFNLQVRQQRAQEEGRFAAEQVAQALTDLQSAERDLQAFLRQNREFSNSPELIFQHDRLQRHVMMRQELYTSLLRSMEQARVDAVRDTPLLAVIDAPANTAEPLGRGTVLRAILGFLLGLMIAFLVAFIREFNRRRNHIDDPAYGDFDRLARQTAKEIRTPSKWLSVGGLARRKRPS